MKVYEKDVVIIGGGLGGCAAALSVCEKGLRVLMTEETDWIGGQLTSQGVPPDEHPWIEEFGATKRYSTLRRKIRHMYKETMVLEKEDANLNPGDGLVSRLCHDPRVALHVLKEMLMPYLLTNQLVIEYHSVVKKVKRDTDQIHKIVGINKRFKTKWTAKVPYFIDATETGDLLPLAHIDYVTGSEAKTETNEPHAGKEAQPNNIQAFTYVLAMEYRPGEHHTIPKPEMYRFWKSFQPSFWPDRYLSFYGPHPVTRRKRKYTLFKEESGFPLWNYRRIYAKDQFKTPIETGDISLMNWPQNDYFLGNIYDVTEEIKEKHLYQAKQLSLSLLYWLQTEAPRSDGKKGYPGLTLRKDIFQTEDGLAKYPYIRESRRIKAEYTVVEQDLSPGIVKGKIGKRYEDSVGIGSYSIDLHPTMTGENYLDIPALPYHIPLGALIPQNIQNVLAGAKNIGTTHITNGCYRLHPTEWNIGEVCGSLVAFCLTHKKTPKEVRNDQHLLLAFQQSLIEDGISIDWPEGFAEREE